jgi:hypothetical protein
MAPVICPKSGRPAGTRVEVLDLTDRRVFCNQCGRTVRLTASGTYPRHRVKGRT